MATRKELKQMAKDQLGNALFQTNWLTMVVVFLVYEAIISLVGGSYGGASGENRSAIARTFSSFLSIAYLVISGPREYGLNRTMVNAAKKNQRADFADLITGFKESMADAIILGVMTKIFIVLWTLLLIIPGIIKSYAYSMASFIQQDSKNKDWNYCIKESMKMMNGHKWDLFVLDLSFFGWYIVGLLCLGVGVLWVTPYHQMTRANFYLELSKSTAPAEEEDGEVIDADVVSDAEANEVFGDK